MIELFEVENYKSLRRVSVGLRPLTVLIGKNDTGKSSFLEALFHLGQLVGENARAAFQGPWAIEQLMTRGVDPTASAIRWRVTLAPSARTGLAQRATYSISANQHPWFRITHETVEVDGRPDIALERGENGVALQESGQEQKLAGRDDGRAALSYAKYSAAVPTLLALARSLASSVRYRFDATRLAEPTAFQVDPDHPEREPRLGDRGEGLPLVLDYLLGSDRRAFDDIEAELRKAVPLVTGIRVKPATIPVAGGQSVSAKALAFQIGNDGQEIPGPLASDGTLLFLAYLTLLHSPASPALVLVEEPENGVHPRQLQRVAALLQRLSDDSPAGLGRRAAQVVVATHSPYLLDFVPPESVLVFGRRANGDTVVKPMIELPQVKERLQGGFSLGELWFNVGEDRLLAEALENEGDAAAPAE